MRRRPLLRTAAIGGGAYMMGKRAAQRQDSAAGQQDQGQQAQQAPQQAPGQAPVSDQLDRLAALRQQGALTDAEFAAAKARLLGT
jgi:Short C-terminal domain